MSDYIEVLDETDPGSNLVGDTLIHTDTIGCQQNNLLEWVRDPFLALSSLWRGCVRYQCWPGLLSEDCKGKVSTSSA